MNESKAIGVGSVIETNGPFHATATAFKQIRSEVHLIRFFSVELSFPSFYSINTE